MTQQQAIDALQALPRGGPGQATRERMYTLLTRLGDPQKQLKGIHIAGTNGKGSLAAMTAAILTAAGYKTGLTISPYVLHFRERMQINGAWIPARTFAALTLQVLDAIEAIRRSGGTPPVQFEAVTAVAFLWFAREKCDFVVLETGLGGRTDATNTLPPENKLVAAITKIGFDHTELLGDTLQEIAAEKAGIITEGCSVVCYPEQPQQAMGPLFTAAAEAHTSLNIPETEDIKIRSVGSHGGFQNRIDYGGYEAQLRLPGAHQANHMAMAIEIALTLCHRYGYQIPDEAILQGLESAFQPARIEILRRHPLLLLDGCHNPDGAAALAKTLTDAGYAGRVVGVMGVLADKNIREMLDSLAPCFVKLYTVTPNSPRAMQAEALQKIARTEIEEGAESCPHLGAAIRKAVRKADRENLAGVCVCGSLYLAAEARPILKREAEK